MTQLSHSFGFIWGISTGENAEKYKIDPELTLGFVYRNKISKNSTFTISGTTFIKGNLKERTCVANYGDIGGIQTVNCRLAASTLSPSETLNYLVNEKPNLIELFLLNGTININSNIHSFVILETSFHKNYPPITHLFTFML